MSQRREISERVQSLNDIHDVLGAMKALASVEIRRIETFIASQREALGVIDTAYAHFLAHYPFLKSATESASDILCVLGSERGFCGDFNKKIIHEAEHYLSQASCPTQVILIGNKLAESTELPVHNVIQGASVSEEIPAVLHEWLSVVLTHVVKSAKQGVTLGLVVLHQASTGELSVRRLLPVPYPESFASGRSSKLHIHVSSQSLCTALTDHYLYALLNTLYYDSLLVENHQRLEHMDSAIRKLEENLEDLTKKKNHLRQAEIIEDIEMILLNVALKARSE